MDADKFYFFWRGPFSQWVKSPFKMFGKHFSCAEQSMMYSKARFFGDEEIADKIMNTSSPREQKDLGRIVKNFDQSKWDDVARKIVYQINHCKFSQNPEFNNLMKENTGKMFVEASPYDKIWGIGMDEENPDRFDVTKWNGKNWLGECITRVSLDLFHQESFELIVRD